MADADGSQLFRGKYRIPSARLSGWDYTSAGWYFVTICVKNRLPCLAEIVNGVMRLTPMGEIVAEEWQRTAHIRPNVALDAWVVMPDHFHALIGIVALPAHDDARRGNDDARRGETGARRGETDARRGETDARRGKTDARRGHIVETPRRGVSTGDTGDTGDAATAGAASATADASATVTAAASAAWKSNSLGAIIGQFKSVCTKRIWAAGFRHFAWQARFYDHIVRSESELERIRAYILANPSRWEEDKQNTEAIDR